MSPLQARLAKGYTQAYLSYRARVSERTIRTAEKTGAWPRRWSTRRRYAKALGLTTKDLAVHPPWAELLAAQGAQGEGVALSQPQPSGEVAAYGEAACGLPPEASSAAAAVAYGATSVAASAPGPVANDPRTWAPCPGEVIP